MLHFEIAKAKDNFNCRQYVNLAADITITTPGPSETVVVQEPGVGTSSKKAEVEPYSGLGKRTRPNKSKKDRDGGLGRSGSSKRHKIRLRPQDVVAISPEDPS